MALIDTEWHWQWHSKPPKADAEDGDGSGTEEDEADVINQTKTDDDYKLQMQVKQVISCWTPFLKYFAILDKLDTNKQKLACLKKSSFWLQLGYSLCNGNSKVIMILSENLCSDIIVIISLL